MVSCVVYLSGCINTNTNTAKKPTLHNLNLLRKTTNKFILILRSIAMNEGYLALNLLKQEYNYVTNISL